jgi:hypothetical protein
LGEIVLGKAGTDGSLWLNARVRAISRRRILKNLIGGVNCLPER